MSMGLPRNGRENGTQNGWFSDKPISEWIVIIHSFEFVSVCWIYWNLRHWLSEQNWYADPDHHNRKEKGTFCNRGCPSQLNIIWDWLSRPPKYAQVIRDHHHKMRLNIKLVWSTNRQFLYARKIYLARNTCCKHDASQPPPIMILHIWYCLVDIQWYQSWVTNATSHLHHNIISWHIYIYIIHTQNISMTSL